MEVSKEPYRTKEQIRDLTRPAFDPVQDAPHRTGQPMPFWLVAHTMSLIEETSGKNSQTVIKEIIANMFRTAIAVNPSELSRLFYFFIVKLAPEFVGLETGVGHEMVVKAVAKSCGKSVQQIRDAFKKEGDLGLVAASSKRSQKNLGSFFGAAKPTKDKTGVLFKDVFATFEKIAGTSGSSSVAEKEQTIVKLL